MSDDETALICAAIFRDLVGLANAPDGHALTQAELITRPLDEFDVDSLSVMEFVMAVEERFDVVLDELAVNRCRTLGDFARLVEQAKGV